MKSPPNLNLPIKLNAFSKTRPLFKKVINTEPKNYRLISLLPLISKVVGKTIII